MAADAVTHPYDSIAAAICFRERRPAYADKNDCAADVETFSDQPTLYR